MDYSHWKKQIDRDSPIPMYYQLKQLIISDINSGALKEGDYMPPELELSTTLCMSRPTVRQALSNLTSEGYLIRQRGKGSVITAPKVEVNYIKKLESIHQELEHRGMVPNTKVIELKRCPAIVNVNEILKLSEAAPLILIKRICYADGQPMVYFESYLSAERFARLLDADVENKSLYGWLDAEYGTRVVHVHRQIEVMNAPKQMAEELGIARGKAIFLVHNTAFDTAGTPVEYSLAYYRGDRSVFTMDMWDDK